MGSGGLAGNKVWVLFIAEMGISDGPDGLKVMGVLGWWGSWKTIYSHHEARSLSQCRGEYGWGEWQFVVKCVSGPGAPILSSQPGSMGTQWGEEIVGVTWRTGLSWVFALSSSSPVIAGGKERIFSFFHCWSVTSWALLEVAEVCQSSSCRVQGLLARTVCNSQGWFLNTSKICPRILRKSW